MQGFCLRRERPLFKPKVNVAPVRSSLNPSSVGFLSGQNTRNCSMPIFKVEAML
jgi:hypothetical protein